MTDIIVNENVDENPVEVVKTETQLLAEGAASISVEATRQANETLEMAKRIAEDQNSAKASADFVIDYVRTAFEEINTRLSAIDGRLDDIHTQVQIIAFAEMVEQENEDKDENVEQIAQAEANVTETAVEVAEFAAENPSPRNTKKRRFI